MKVVREHINEKFTEDSDPVKDMGVGMWREVYRFCENDKGALSTASLGIKNKEYRCLVYCIQEKQYEYVKFMLDEGVTPHITYRHSEMEIPLRWAIANNDIQMIDLLIKYGADIKKSISSYELYKKPICDPYTQKYIRSLLKRKKNKNAAH